MRRIANALGWLLLTSLLLVGTFGIAFAQDDLDDLDDLDEDVVTEKPFEPGLENRKWELIFGIGYLNLSHTLVQADQILVDWADGEKIFGDMEMSGQTSFSPQVKLGRTWSRFSLENSLGFAIGDFAQTIDNIQLRPVDSDQTLSENDPERGSYFMWYHDTALSYHIFKKGRLLPFLSLGIGRQYYHMDSKFIVGSAQGTSFSYGGGIRIVGDELFSVRAEVRNFTGKITFDHSATFLTNQIDPDEDDTLIDIPLTNLDVEGQEVPFGGYAEETFNNLWYSIGLVASF